MPDKRDPTSETVIFKPGDLSLCDRDRQGVLTVIRGSGADLGKSVAIGKELTIGRADGCGLRLADMQVSSSHARVVLETDCRYTLHDVGSTNGTRLNRNPLSAPARLSEGDKIFIGQTVLRFTMADAVDRDFHDALTQLVHTDPLTGLDAKRSFDDTLAIALASAGRAGTPLSLLMMDLDGLKAINDTHGHQFGAHTIGEAGRLIGRIVGERGRACRFGGDEFTVMLPGHDKTAATALAEEIRRSLEQAGFELNGVPLQPTISIGVATSPDDADTPGQLLEAADQALYRAKRAGKNRVSV